MFNFDYVTKEDMKKQSKLARYSWPPIQNINSWKFLIWKNKWLIINPINHEPDIDKIYLYAKDPYEAKYQLLISKRESTGLMIQKPLSNTQMKWYKWYLKNYWRTQST